MKSTTLKVISLLLLVAVMLGVTSCSLTGSDEEETTEATTVASATVLPDSDAAMLGYFNGLMEKIKNGTATLKYSSNYGARDFDCDNEAFKASLPTLVKLMRDALKEEQEVKYGDPLSDIIPIKGTGNALSLSVADVVAIAVNGEEHSKAAEEASKKVEDESYTYEEINTDPDVRKITITLKDETDPQVGASLFGSIFALPDRELIKAEFDKAKGYIEYDGTYTAKYTGCTIYMEIDRVTDNVAKLEFHRNIEVSTTVTGVGTLASMGTFPLSFVVDGTDRYEFDWSNPEAVENDEA